MPPAAAASKPAAPKKRHRKRKRRVASSSSSSSSSGSDSESSASDAFPKPSMSAKAAGKQKAQVPVEDSDQPMDSSSAEESSSEEEISKVKDQPLPDKSTKQKAFVADDKEDEDDEDAEDAEDHLHDKQTEEEEDGPLPQPVPIPPFLPPPDAPDYAEKEQKMRERFKKFWMECIAEGFESDLEVLRKEPDMTTSRLALLIDSLAAGADVFSSSAKPGTGEINEMQMVLEGAGISIDD